VGGEVGGLNVARARRFLGDAARYLRAMRVYVYDWFGNDRVAIDLDPGDVVQYKRNGRVGFCTATFRGEQNGRGVFEFKDGSVVRLNAYRSIIHAFRNGEMLGKPKDPVRCVTIEEVEAPSAKWIGHISARDSLGRECYWNGRCDGWPSVLPDVGEKWTVEVRLQKFAEFVQKGSWYFVSRTTAA
jgi:hypothetical protein